MSVVNEKLHIVLAGNPGVGKSTILNSLTGSTTAVFKSGVSIGTVMTTVLQKHETDAYVLGDTPGLQDIETKKKAAEEIVKLFRSVKFMKLIFVVTLEAGRIRPVDVTTMDLMLSSFQDIDMTNRFGVIINKVSAKVKAKIADKESILVTFAALNVKFKTCHIVINDHDETLADDDDIMSEPTHAVLDLITHVSTIEVEGVSDIHIDELQQLREEYEAKINKIYSLLNNEKSESQKKSAALLSLNEERMKLISQAAEMFRADPFNSLDLAFSTLWGHIVTKAGEVVEYLKHLF